MQEKKRGIESGMANHARVNDPFKQTEPIQGRNEIWLIVALCTVGLLSAIYFFRLLDHYPYNSGRNLIGAYVPPLLAVCYLVATAYRRKPDRKIFLRAFLLYLILLVPFMPLMLQVFKPTFGDDFHRYYVYARYMIDNHTLYGSDNLAFPGQGRYYLTQPGYRYFIAAELAAFHDLYRFVQFLNLAMWVFGIFIFVKVIKEVSGREEHRILLTLLLLTPYAIKNSIMGLSEWLTGLLLILSCWLYVVKK
ncbi:MAG TPA: hypothetical protein VNR87_14465, partial [Flavisolibacter sp.]|nr:hypothetical protein [Flavisolibacter sp.]